MTVSNRYGIISDKITNIDIIPSTFIPVIFTKALALYGALDGSIRNSAILSMGLASRHLPVAETLVASSMPTLKGDPGQIDTKHYPIRIFSLIFSLHTYF